MRAGVQLFRTEKVRPHMWQVMSTYCGSVRRSASGRAESIAAARSGEHRHANAIGVVRRSSAWSSPRRLRMLREATARLFGSETRQHTS